MNNMERRVLSVIRDGIARLRKEPRRRQSRERSRSGNYKSIRHLMEASFAKNQKLTKEEACAIVKKEFPNAAFLVNPTAHFGWYKSHIVSHGEYQHVTKPKAKVKAVAKIK